MERPCTVTNKLQLRIQKGRKRLEGTIRLNKYLSDAGVCSRREADRLVENGKVMVDGEVAVMGMQICPGQKVVCDGKPVGEKEKPVFLIVNKPRGIVCTTSDKDHAENIVEFLNYPQRIYPVGRLDKDSEGLLLMTNQGDIVNKILRGGNAHEKEYAVAVDHPVTEEFLKQMCEGVRIEDLDVTTKPCRAWKTGSHTFHIVLTQGLNRQIRRMCRALDYHVMNLKRVRIMNIQLGTLKRGEYRELTEKELSDLMKLVEGSTNLPAREAAKIGKLVDPAKAAGKTARSGYQGKKNDRKPFVKNGERKPFEKKSGTGKVWRNVREDSEKKPEKKAPASPESWKPGAPERKEHKIWTTRSRG